MEGNVCFTVFLAKMMSVQIPANMMRVTYLDLYFKDVIEE